MVNPELYSNSNSITKNAAIKCLEEYAPKLNWMKHGESIIDLGCGDGSVTCILKEYVPNDYAKFVACDIRETVIEFAKERYSDKNIIFKVFDIVSDIPDDMNCGFSHVFSFFMLHWIHDQKKAFENIYNLMNDGGECLLTIAGYNPITYLYDVICKDKNMKWSSSWIKTLNIFVSTQYVYMKNADKYLTEIMTNIGFINIDVQFKRRVFIFKNIVDLKDFIKAVEPYGMPDDVFDEFFHDFMSLGKEKNIFDKGLNDMNDVNQEIKYEYEMFIVHAIKPK